MPTVLQFRRGTTAQNNAFTGSAGEVSIDTDLDTLVVHDGSTAGGHTLVTDTATQTLTNKTLTSPNITGLQLGGVAVTATAAELNYVDGVTSAIQTQLNAKGTVNSLSDLSITATATELNYVDGVTSAIQTQLNSKQATITGAATTIDTENLTVSRALVSDGSGKVAVSAVTSTEIGYLDGVTSAIQTQLNAKAPLASPTLTGTPAAPTAAVNTNTTQIATTAYVVAQIADDAPTKTGTGASGTWGINITGTAALATSVTATANNTANETVYLTFVDGATGTQGIETDTNLTYNPSTNVLSTTATSARYADLAEKYTTDQDYEPGTVVVVGGEAEATACSSYSDHKVLGIISTAPAYLMNSTSEGQDVALIGRVPCKVIGPIERGDLLVTSSTGGHAEAWDPQNFIPGSVVGKALDAKDSDGEGVIEVAVGKV